MSNILPTDQFDQQVLNLINQERKQRNLEPLSLSEKLDTAADLHSQDMAENGYYSHRSRDGSRAGDRMRREGYQWRMWAENIARGQRSAEDVVKAWMNSSGHRKMILHEKFTHVGVGYANPSRPYWTLKFAFGDSNPGKYVAQTSGSPNPAPTPPTPAPVQSQPPAPAPTPAPQPTQPTQQPTNNQPTSELTDKFDKDVLNLVNQERKKRNLKLLSLSEKLDTAADLHSQDMAENGYYSHRSKDGSRAGDRMRRQGYQWRMWGENIARGQRSAEEVVEAWMNSSGHRSMILNEKFTHVGVGYANPSRPYWTLKFATGDSNPGKYVPQTSGSPNPAPTPPTPAPAPAPAPQPNNIISGNNRGNYIRGTTKDDTIFGLGGRDLLLGKNGNDTLDGGSGNDILYGNQGRDTFVIGSGIDIIKDFEDGIDRIQLKGVSGSLSLRQRGNSVSIFDSEGSQFANVTLANGGLLNQQDFVWS